MNAYCGLCLSLDATTGFSVFRSSSIAASFSVLSAGLDLLEGGRRYAVELESIFEPEAAGHLVGRAKPGLWRTMGPVQMDEGQRSGWCEYSMCKVEHIQL
jgi:hypothetical protein